MAKPNNNPAPIPGIAEYGWSVNVATATERMPIIQLAAVHLRCNCKLPPPQRIAKKPMDTEQGKKNTVKKNNGNQVG